MRNLIFWVAWLIWHILLISVLVSIESCWWCDLPDCDSAKSHMVNLLCLEIKYVNKNFPNVFWYFHPLKISQPILQWKAWQSESSQAQSLAVCFGQHLDLVHKAAFYGYHSRRPSCFLGQQLLELLHCCLITGDGYVTCWTQRDWHSSDSYHSGEHQACIQTMHQHHWWLCHWNCWKRHGIR